LRGIVRRFVFSCRHLMTQQRFSLPISNPNLRRTLWMAGLCLFGWTSAALAQSTADTDRVQSAGAPPTAAGSIASAILPHDLSPWGMFLSADLIVKAVMIGLAFASVLTWTVLITKSVELARAKRRQRLALVATDGARTLAEAAKSDAQTGISAKLIAAAQAELALSADALHDADGLKERVVLRLDDIEADHGRHMTTGIGLLATIGATAPFVGLFGTVWGIMNSFIGISRAQTTNLAVVAPGIAEALLATAIGLVAAIPAVVIYNYFTRQIVAYKALVAETASAVLRLVSRDLSRGVHEGVRVVQRGAAE
jgi:biopolymer transport protein ExbB